MSQLNRYPAAVATASVGDLPICKGQAPNFCRAAMATASAGSTGYISMFRVLFLAATAAALAACAGSESARQAEFRADDAKCRSYGADTSTDAYVQCRLAIDLQKAHAERAAEAARRQRPRP
jgi:hypothetical protein